MSRVCATCQQPEPTIVFSNEKTSHCVDCRNKARNDRRNKYQRDKRRAQPEEAKANDRRRFLARKARGQCNVCTLPRLPNSETYCEKHWYCMVSQIHKLGGFAAGADLKKLAEAQNFRCAYTGLELVPGLTMSLDHKIPKCVRPDLAYDLSNIQWVHPTVNLAKSMMTHDQFLTLCTLVAARAVGTFETVEIPNICGFRPPKRQKPDALPTPTAT